ncbi:hypothetical protein [Natronococcus occultus]|uniref:hypothetical protein n=1 Tax=Natronococcus occultus TaxID=29288 RepID=UPI0015776D02|nr:hypothetical protein [Natronococcus occultus]
MQQPSSSLLRPGVAWRVLRPSRLEERPRDEPREPQLSSAERDQPVRARRD